MMKPEESDLPDWIWEQHEEYLAEFFSHRMPDTMRDMLTTISVGEAPEQRLQSLVAGLLMDDWHEQYDAHLEKLEIEEAEAGEYEPPMDVTDFLTPREMLRKF